MMINLYHESTTMCVEIRNLTFKNISARAPEVPCILGRAVNIVSDISFINCSFEKVDDSVYPNYETRGYAKALRDINAQIFKNAEKVSFHNTAFTYKQITA